MFTEPTDFLLCADLPFYLAPAVAPRGYMEGHVERMGRGRLCAKVSDVFLSSGELVAARQLPEALENGMQQALVAAMHGLLGAAVPGLVEVFMTVHCYYGSAQSEEVMVRPMAQH